jgi:Uma2 family endonuclease
MSILIPRAAAAGEEDVEYPASDGQPMAETGLHVRAILVLFQALEDALPATEFVAADMYWYWEKGHIESRIAPDVMVVKGVGRAERRSFFTWREGGAVPSAVFEMASEHTWREDLGEKRRCYERLGVREYILFDPEGQYLRPRLLAFRLVEGRYALIEPDADDRLLSEELGLWIKAEGLMLRLIDAGTGSPVPTQQERAGQAEQQVEQAVHRAEQAEQQAEQERRHAETLAAEVERLKALLDPGGGGSGETA